jgi:TonB family protein
MKNRCLENFISMMVIVGVSGCGGAAQPPPAAAPTPPHVSTNPSPIVQSGPDPDEVVAALRGEFSSCYQGGLWINPTQQGSVRLQLDIDSVGHPKSVRSTGGAGLDRRVLDCLDKVASRAMFAPPKGGSTTVVIPLSFAVAQ